MPLFCKKDKIPSFIIQYRDNLNSLIGKMATVKYFGFTNTENPVPNLPVLKSFRLNEDM